MHTGIRFLYQNPVSAKKHKQTIFCDAPRHLDKQEDKFE